MLPRPAHLPPSTILRRSFALAGVCTALALGMVAAPPSLAPALASTSPHARTYKPKNALPPTSSNGSMPAAGTPSSSNIGGSYTSDLILVKYAATPPPTRVASAHTADLADPAASDTPPRLLRLPRGASLTATLSRLRRRHDVLWAVPDYRAHTSSMFIPNDPGLGHTPTGWEAAQWNFVGPFGVNAPEAWANVAADGHPGGRGVIVAVLDTGVAYANRGRFRRSPDFSRYEFVRGYDFIAHNPYPNDHNGHGTFVAATIAESTNNRFGLTGLAYGVRLMPVRVLNSQG
jgi:serine protease